MISVVGLVSVFFLRRFVCSVVSGTGSVRWWWLVAFNMTWMNSCWVMISGFVSLTWVWMLGGVSSSVRM